MLQKDKKCDIKILLGNPDEPINMVHENIIRNKIGDKYNLTFISMSNIDCEELLELAHNHDFDISILVLNNIYPNKIFPDEDRKIGILKLIKYLKDHYNKPVIALYGWNLGDPDIANKAVLAGANFCLPIPTEVEDLTNAVEKCLEIVFKSP